MNDASPSMLSKEMAFLNDGGEMGALMRERDWLGSPLGGPASWPQSLKSMVGLLLNSRFPMFVAWGEELGFLYNDAYAEILGTKHPAALGRCFRDVWSEIWPDIEPLIQAALAGDGAYREDLPLLMNRKGFDERTWFTFSYSPARDESGRVAGMFCVCTETTAQVLSDRTLAAERDRQRLMLQQMPGFVAVLSGPEHRYDYVNDAYVTISGPRDFLGRSVREVFPELEGQGFHELLDQVYATGQRVVSRGRPLRLAGQEAPRVIDFLFEPVRDDAGAVTGIFVGGYDVTEAHRAQDAVRASEARLTFLDRLGAETAALAGADAVLQATTRLVGEHLGVSVCAYADMDEDQDGFTIRGDWAAPGSRSIVGRYSLADFGRLAVRNLGAGLPLVVHDNLCELAPEEAATFQGIGIAATICMPLVKEGRLTALMAIHDKAPRRWTDEELTLLREVTERSWAHVERAGALAELRASEAQFRIFAQAMPNHVWAAHPDGSLYWLNDQVYAYSGEPEGSLHGAATWTAIVHPDDRPAAGQAWAHCLATGEVYETEFRIRRADGAYRWFLVRAEPVRGPGGNIVNWVGTNADIEDRKRQSEQLAQLNATLEQKVEERTRELMLAEDALRQAQKMEAVGQLTGGLAHDFNNLLTGISGSLEMMGGRIAQGRMHDVDRYLLAAQGAAKRAAALTHRLLAFSRRQTLDPRPTDVNALV